MTISTKPTVTNVAMTSSGTEYKHALASKTNRVLIKLRSGAVALKLAYVAAASGTTYITIPAGASKEIQNIKGTGLTLYFQAATASQTLEVEEWQ